MNVFNNYSIGQLQTMLSDYNYKLQFVIPNSQDHYNINNNIIAIQNAIAERSRMNGYIPTTQQVQPGYGQQVVQQFNQQQYQPSVPNVGVESYGIQQTNPYNTNYLEPTPQTNSTNKQYNRYNKHVQQQFEEQNKVKQEPVVETAPEYITINYTDTHNLDLVKFDIIEDVPNRLAMAIPAFENHMSNIVSYNIISTNIKNLKVYSEGDEDASLDFKDIDMSKLVESVKSLCVGSNEVAVYLDKRLTKFVNKCLKYMVNGNMDGNISEEIGSLINTESTVTNIDVKVKIKTIKELLLEKIKNITLSVKSKVTDKTSIITCESKFVVAYSNDLNLKKGVNNWIVSNTEGSLYKTLKTITDETGFSSITLICNNKEYDVIKYHDCFIILGE